MKKTLIGLALVLLGLQAAWAADTAAASPQILVTFKQAQAVAAPHTGAPGGLDWRGREQSQALSCAPGAEARAGSIHRRHRRRPDPASSDTQALPAHLS